MADNDSQVSGDTTIPELPTPTIGDSHDSSPSANVDDALVSKIIDKLMPTLEEKINRTTQSTKDKRLSKFEKALGSLGLLDELAEQGVQIPKDIRDDFRFRELESRLAQSQVQSDPGRSQAPTDAVSGALAELQKYELTSNDPAFIEILRGQYPNKDAFDAKVKSYILEKKLAPSNPPSPATVIQSASVGKTDTSPERLKSEYIKEMQANRGNKAAIKAIQEKYRKQGFDTGSVGFGV